MSSVINTMDLSGTVSFQGDAAEPVLVDSLRPSPGTEESVRTESADSSAQNTPDTDLSNFSALGFTPDDAPQDIPYTGNLRPPEPATAQEVAELDALKNTFGFDAVDESALRSPTPWLEPEFVAPPDVVELLRRHTGYEYDQAQATQAYRSMGVAERREMEYLAAVEKIIPWNGQQVEAFLAAPPRAMAEATGIGAFPAGDLSAIADGLSRIHGKTISVGDVRDMLGGEDGETTVRRMWNDGLLKVYGESFGFVADAHKGGRLSDDGLVALSRARRRLEDLNGGILTDAKNLLLDVEAGAANMIASGLAGGGRMLNTVFGNISSLAYEQAKIEGADFASQLAEQREQARERGQAIDDAAAWARNQLQMRHYSQAQAGGALYRIASQAAQGTGTTLVSMALAPFRGAGAATIMLSSYDEAYQTGISMGMSPEQASLWAIPVGAGMGALEFAGADTLFRGATAAARPLRQRAAVLAVGGIGEALTEGGQSLLGNFGMEGAAALSGVDTGFGKDKALEYTWDAFQDFGMGGLVGFGIGGAGQTARITETLIADSAWVKARAARTEVLNALRGSRKDLTANPDTMDAVTRKMLAESGQDERVFVQAQSFVRHFKGDQARLDQALAAAKVTQQDLAVALETDGQIVADNAGLIQFMGKSDVDAALNDMVQIEPDAPTMAVLAEREAVQTQVAAELAVIREGNAPLPEILVNIRNQMAQSGIDDQAAQDYTDATYAFARVGAARMNITAEQFINLYPVQVRLERIMQAITPAGIEQSLRQAVAPATAPADIAAVDVGPATVQPQSGIEGASAVVAEDVATPEADRQWTDAAIDTLVKAAGIDPSRVAPFVQYARNVLDTTGAVPDAQTLGRVFNTADMLASGTDLAAQGLRNILAEAESSANGIPEAVMRQLGLSDADTAMTDIMNRIAELDNRAGVLREFYRSPEMMRRVERSAETWVDRGQRGDSSVLPGLDVNTVRLFQGRYDRSTMMHEMYHVFHGHMRTAAMRAGPDSRVYRDFMTMNKAVGGGLDSPDDDTRLAAEERGAEMFERYLFEGQAPSVELADAFADFRKWLTDIYRDVQGYVDEGLRPEVRDVFDRMLASEQEIAEAHQYYETVAALRPPTGVDAATAQTTEEGNRRLLDDMSTRQQRRNAEFNRLAQANSSNARRNVSREVNDTRQFKAIDSIELRGNISEATAAELAGDAVAAGLKRHGIITQDGKATIEDLTVIAGDKGYRDAPTMLRELAQSPTRSQAIDMLYEQRMGDYEAFLKVSAGVGGAVDADAAYHTADLSKTLAGKQSILDRQALEQAAADGRRAEQQISDNVMVRVARDTIAAKTVGRSGDYRTHATAYRKAVAEAARLDMAGDKVGAAQAFQRARMNHHLIRESIAVKEEVADFQKERVGNQAWSAILNGTQEGAAGPVVAEYANYLKSLTNRYRLTTDPRFAASTDADGRVSMPDVAAAADPAVAAIVPPMVQYLPGWIADNAAGADVRTWRDLTVGQMRELRDALDYLIRRGRGTLTGRLEQYGSVDGVVKESVKRMKERKDKPLVRHGIRGAIDSIVGWSILIENRMGAADGNTQITGKGMGPAQAVITEVSDALSHAAAANSHVAQALAPSMKTLRQAIRRIDNSAVQPMGETPKVLAKAYGSGAKWNGEAGVMAALYSFSANGRRSVMEGYGLSAERLQSIASQFTAAELKAMQHVLDTTDALYNQSKGQTAALTGRQAFDWHTRYTTVVSSDGQKVTMRGGYFPTRTDRTVRTAAGQYEGTEASKRFDVMDAARGMEAAPTDYKVFPPRLTLNSIVAHTEAATRYIHAGQAIATAAQVFTNEEWSKMYLRKFGQADYDMVMRWLQRQADPDSVGRGEATYLDAGINKIRNLTTTVTLGFNTNSALRQRLDMTSAANNMTKTSRTGASGGVYILRAMKALGWGNLGIRNKLAKEIYQKSAFMRGTGANIDVSLREIISDAQAGEGTGFRIPDTDITLSKAKMDEWAFKFMEMNDQGARLAAWWGAYQMAMDGKADFDPAGMTDAQLEAAAVRYADGVGKVFSATTTADQSEIQAARGIARLFTMYMSGTVRKSGRIYQYIDAYQQGKMSAGNLVHSIAMESAVPALSWTLANYMGKLLLSSLTGGDFDDELDITEMLVEDVFLEALLSPIEGVPGVNSISSVAKYGFADALLPGPLSTGVKTAKDIIGVKTSVEKGKYGKAARAGGRVAARLTGVPVDAGMKSLERVGDFIGVAMPWEDGKQKRK